MATSLLTCLTKVPNLTLPSTEWFAECPLFILLVSSIGGGFLRHGFKQTQLAVLGSKRWTPWAKGLFRLLLVLTYFSQISGC